MGWKGESRRHSLSRKGIKTNIDKTKRLSVRNFVARGRTISEDDLYIIASNIQKGNVGSYNLYIRGGDPFYYASMDLNYKNGYKEPFVLGITESHDEATDIIDETRTRLIEIRNELSASGCKKASGNIQHFGSQAREKIEDTDEKYRMVSKKGKEAVLFNPDSNTYERWYKNDDYAGYVIEIDGAGYEFANSMRKGHVFKVWSGRYSKIVEAKDHQDAIKQSGYVNADQVDRIG